MKKNDEEYIQIYVASFLRKLQAKPGVDFMFHHSPNGGARSKSEAGKFKLMGTLAGFPDILVMGAGESFFIELKKDDGKLSTAQKDFIGSARRYGFPVHIIYAKNAIDGVEQAGVIMCGKFGINQNGISCASKSVISSIA